MIPRSNQIPPSSPVAHNPDYIIDVSSEAISAQKFLQEARKNFIRKVYTILALQLLATIIIVIAIDVSGAGKHLATPYGGFTGLGHVIFWVGLLLVIGTTIVLTCYPETARRVPYNYILLSIYTLAFSAFLSVISGVAQPKYVITALVLTATMTIALTAYACKTKKEFSYKGAAWFLIIWLIFALPLNLFVFRPLLGYSMAFTVLSIILVIFYGFFLVFDTKLIVGQKKSQLQLGVDEYIIGALMLYSDIVGLFIALLSTMRC